MSDRVPLRLVPYIDAPSLLMMFFQFHMHSLCFRMASVLTGRNTMMQRKYTADGMESRVPPASSATYFHQTGLIRTILHRLACLPRILCQPAGSFRIRSALHLHLSILLSSIHDYVLKNSRQICIIVPNSAYFFIFRSSQKSSLLIQISMDSSEEK